MADRYWVGGSGTWNSSNTANWSAATPVTITSASRSGNTLTTTGSPALVVGMTVWYNVDQYTGTFTSAGTITGGSGNTWTTSGSGTISSQQMYAATTGAAVPTSADNARFGVYAGSQLSTVTVSGSNSCLSFFHSGDIEFGGPGSLSVSSSFNMNNAPASNTFSVPLTFSGSTTGRSFNTNFVTYSNVTVDASGGAVTVQQDLTCNVLTLTAGSLTIANGVEVVVTSFNSSNSNVRSLTFGTGNWQVTGSGASWNCANSTNLTVSYPVGGNLLYFAASSSVSFYGGGKSWPYILNILTGSGTTSSTNVLTIEDGGNTFYAVSVGANSGKSRGIKFPGPYTTTILNDFILAGVSGALVYIGSTNASAATVSKASGTVSASYTSISYSTATGGARFEAYSSNGNVDGGNNTGWQFSQGSGNFMAFF